MKTYESFSELNDDYPEIHDSIASFLTEEDLQETCMWSLGGDVHIIETEEEYREMLDDHDFLDMAEETIPGWFLFLLCTNNAGGPSYYVPTHMVNATDYEWRL